MTAAAKLVSQRARLVSLMAQDRHVQLWVYKDRSMAFKKYRDGVLLYKEPLSADEALLMQCRDAGIPVVEHAE